jgi:hypothetical protein
MFGYFPLSWDDNSTSTRDSHELFLGQVQISILASNYIKSFSDHPHWRNHHLHLSLIVFRLCSNVQPIFIGAFVQFGQLKFLHPKKQVPARASASSAAKMMAN